MSNKKGESRRFVRRKINNNSIVCLRDAERALGITVETLHKYVRNGLPKQDVPDGMNARLTFIDLREAWTFHKEWVARIKEERRERTKNMVQNYGEKRAKNYRLSRIRKSLNKEIERKCVLLSKYCFGEVDDDFVKRLSKLKKCAIKMVELEYPHMHPFHKLAWEQFLLLNKYKSGELEINDCPETEEAIAEAEEEERRRGQGCDPKFQF